MRSPFGTVVIPLVFGPLAACEKGDPTIEPATPPAGVVNNSDGGSGGY